MRRKRRGIVELTEVAPAQRGCFIERGIDLVAQRRGKGGFVAGLHRDCVDQWRPEILGRPQHLRERLGLGRKSLHLPLCRFHRLARLCLVLFRTLQERAGFGGFGAHSVELRNRFMVRDRQLESIAWAMKS